MQALVSVVIPVYNGERFVAEAVDSALAQDHPNKEILVIDDGSRDRSLDILARYGSAIRVISVSNGGPARARNLGMREARGDYIAFLDTDDIWASGKLSAQVAHMQAHPATGVCYTAWHVWPADADGQWRRPAAWRDDLGAVHAVPERSGWIYGELLLECHLLTTTVMVRTSVARAEGEFDVELPVGEDYDYWLRLSQRACIDRLNCVSALYRVVPGSASRKPHAVNHELLVLQRALGRYGYTSPGGAPIDRGVVAARLNVLRFQHAWGHLHGGDPAVAQEIFALCLRQQPWRLPLWRHWLRARLRAARAALPEART